MSDTKNAEPTKPATNTGELSDEELASISGGPTAVENLLSRAMLACNPATSSLNFSTQAHGSGGGAG